MLFYRWLLTGAFLVAVISCANNNDTSQPIAIGFYGPLSGNIASFGTQVRNGVVYAIDEVNAGVGVLGRKIRLIEVDDRGSPEEAQNAVTRLITKDRVVAVIGEPTSSGSLAGAAVCQKSRTPMITPTATNPRVTQMGDYIFRVCWTDSFQGNAMARFAIRSLKSKRMGILFDVSSDYSVGLAEDFSKTYGAAGGQIVAKESYTTGDNNFVAQLTSMKITKPDAIFVPGYYTEVGLIARQARSAGITCPLLGPDGWDAPELWQIGGRALNDSFYFAHFHPESPQAEVRRFVDGYKKRYGRVPLGGSALAYDAVKIVVRALETARSTERTRLRDSLANVRDFPGVTGRITIGPQRDALKPGVVLRINQGKLDLVETVGPE